MSKKLNNEQLREMVWSNMQKVSGKKMKPSDLNAIVGGARAILAGEKLVLDFAKTFNRKPTANETRFITSN
jgi:hypothetical protein